MSKDKNPKLVKLSKVSLLVVAVLLLGTVIFSVGYYKGSMDMHTYLRDITIGYDKMCQDGGHGRMVVDRTLVPSGIDSTIHMSCSAYSNIVYEYGECALVTFGDNPGEYWCEKQ